MSEPVQEGTQRALPRGRHAASREVVARSQRERLLSAMATVVARNGYAATAVADVLSEAGVSRKSFYEHFANKQDCFLQAYDHGVDRILDAIEEAMAREQDAFGLAAAGVSTYLAWLTANPAFARTFLLEALAAGPDALERRAAVHERFAEHFERAYAAAQSRMPELGPLPDYRFRAAVGATDELVLEHVRVHGPATLQTLTEPMLDVIIGLLVGHDAAAHLAQ
jgi:AcrR family transcriptional regulator